MFGTKIIIKIINKTKAPQKMCPPPPHLDNPNPPPPLLYKQRVIIHNKPVYFTLCLRSSMTKRIHPDQHVMMKVGLNIEEREPVFE